MRLLQTNIENESKARPLRVGASVTIPTNTIYFDASCGMCSASARRFHQILRRYGFTFLPLQDPGASELLGMHADQIPDEMKLRTRIGTVLGGVDAIVYICRRIWWAWPVWGISKIPGAMSLFRRIYRLFATNRHRISGACRI